MAHAREDSSCTHRTVWIWVLQVPRNQIIMEMINNCLQKYFIESVFSPCTYVSWEMLVLAGHLIFSMCLLKAHKAVK